MAPAPVRCFGLSCRAAWCGVIIFLASAPLTAKDYSLKLDLDPLLALPGLWSLKPDDLGAKFSAQGFKENPYFRWAQGGQEHAKFSRKPFTNITVDVTIFGGKLPVQTAHVHFKGEKVARVDFVVASPGEEDGPKPETISGWQAECEKQLGTMVGGSPAPQSRSFGGVAEKTVESKAWQGAGAVGALDAAPAEKFLRFTLLPPGSDVKALMAEPVLELLARNSTSLFVNLDSFLTGTDVWGLTPRKLEETFTVAGYKETPFFKWLTQDHASARFSRRPYSNVTVDLTLFGGKLAPEEAVIEFKDGKASAVSVSLFNRGDSGQIDKTEFDTRYKTAGRSLGELLKVAPRERKPTAQTAVKVTGWLWTAPGALALLEFNADAMDKKGQPEFLRLKLSPPAGRDQLLGIAAIGRDATTLKPAELLQFVKKEGGGDVFVGGVPMVDQGDKGYCVVASCQRLFSYLHVQCDQHELASLAGSDADRGTSSVAFAAALAKIGSRFKVHFKPLVQKRPEKIENTMKPDKFAKLVQDHVNKGLPLLWSLELGLYKEEPPISMQGRGGHMRLIIGYNAEKEELIFTDSWGAGHELKRMNLTDALKATTGVYAVEPQVRL